jgi:hypothetical protein
MIDREQLTEDDMMEVYRERVRKESKIFEAKNGRSYIKNDVCDKCGRHFILLECFQCGNGYWSIWCDKCKSKQKEKTK